MVPHVRQGDGPAPPDEGARSVTIYTTDRQSVPTLIVEAVLLATRVPVPGAAPARFRTLLRPVFVAPTATATGFLGGAHAQQSAADETLHRFAGTQSGFRLVLRVVGPRPDRGLRLSLHEALLSPVGGRTRTLFVEHMGVFYPGADPYVYAGALSPVPGPGEVAPAAGVLPRVRLQVCDQFRRVLYARTWFLDVGGLNADAVSWLRDAHVDLGGLLPAGPSRDRDLVCGAADEAPPEGASPAPDEGRRARPAPRRGSRGALSVSGSFVNVDEADRVSVGPAASSASSAGRGAAAGVPRRREDAPPEGRAENPPAGSSGAVDMLQQLGFWLYGSLLGQLVTGHQGDTFSRDAVKTFYSPAPLWLMGREFRNDAMPGPRIFALAPVTALIPVPSVLQTLGVQPRVQPEHPALLRPPPYVLREAFLAPPLDLERALAHLAHFLSAQCGWTLVTAELLRLRPAGRRGRHARRVSSSVLASRRPPGDGLEVSLRDYALSDAPAEPEGALSAARTPGRPARGARSRLETSHGPADCSSDEDAADHQAVQRASVVTRRPSTAALLSGDHYASAGGDVSTVAGTSGGDVSADSMPRGAMPGGATEPNATGSTLPAPAPALSVDSTAGPEAAESAEYIAPRGAPRPDGDPELPGDLSADELAAEIEKDAVPRLETERRRRASTRHARRASDAAEPALYIVAQAPGGRARLVVLAEPIVFAFADRLHCSICVRTVGAAGGASGSAPGPGDHHSAGGLTDSAVQSGAAQSAPADQRAGGRSDSAVQSISQSPGPAGSGNGSESGAHPDAPAQPLGGEGVSEDLSAHLANTLGVSPAAQDLPSGTPVQPETPLGVSSAAQDLPSGTHAQPDHMEPQPGRTSAEAGLRDTSATAPAHAATAPPNTAGPAFAEPHAPPAHRRDAPPGSPSSAPDGDASLEARTVFVDTVSEVMALCAAAGGPPGAAVQVVYKEAVHCAIDMGPHPASAPAAGPAPTEAASVLTVSADSLPESAAAGGIDADVLSGTDVLLWSDHVGDWIARTLRVSLPRDDGGHVRLVVAAPGRGGVGEVGVDACRATACFFADASLRVAIGVSAGTWLCLRALCPEDYTRLLSSLPALMRRCASRHRSSGASSALAVGEGESNGGSAPGSPAGAAAGSDTPQAVSPPSASVPPGGVEGMAQFVRAFESRFWFTYRRGFPRIGSTILTSDAGFGCMVRAGQSMLAEAVAAVRFGRRDWTVGAVLSTDAGRARYRAVVALFADTPDERAAPFALHGIVRVGAEMGTPVGQYFGPSTLGRALRRQCDAAVWRRAQWEAAALRGFGAGRENELHDDAPDDEPPEMPIRIALWRQGVLRFSALRASIAVAPHVVLVPLRLGADALNEDAYGVLVRAALAAPQTLGIVGGRANRAFFVVGFQERALLYLDPHVVRPAVPPGALPAAVVAREFHCATVCEMGVAQLDPTLLLCFLVSSEGDVAALESLLAEVPLPMPIFSFE